MLKILIGVLGFLASSVWQHDFEKAKKEAREKHELILLNFSGSDWCIPCIRMEKEIFASDAFEKMADTSLVLVNADFPRLKKNQLSKELQKQNEWLADKYNPKGIFPYTLLLDENGKVLKTWEGLPAGDADRFASDIKSICDANK